MNGSLKVTLVRRKRKHCGYEGAGGRASYAAPWQESLEAGLFPPTMLPLLVGSREFGGSEHPIWHVERGRLGQLKLAGSRPMVNYTQTWSKLLQIKHDF